MDIEMVGIPRRLTPEETSQEVRDFLQYCVSEMYQVLREEIEVTVVLRDPQCAGKSVALSFNGASLDKALEALKAIVEKRPRA